MKANRCWVDVMEYCNQPPTVEVDTEKTRYCFCKQHAVDYEKGKLDDMRYKNLRSKVW